MNTFKAGDRVLFRWYGTGDWTDWVLAVDDVKYQNQTDLTVITYTRLAALLLRS